MKDWTELFKEKLLADSRPLPEGDYELLTGMIRQRKRLRIYRWALGSSLAAAAAVAVVVFLRPPQNAEPKVLSSSGISGGLVAVASSIRPVEDESASPIKAVAPMKRTAFKEEEEEKKETPEIIESQGPEEDAPGVTAPDKKAAGSQGWEPFPLGQETLGTGQKGRLSVSVFTSDVTSVSQDVQSINKMAESGSGFGSPLGSPRPQYQHRSPLNFGVGIRYSLTDRLSLASGLDYLYCRSKVHSPKESLDQTAHYLGIPLHLDFSLIQNQSLSLYIGAGAQAQKCVYAKLGDNSIKDQRVYFSAIGLAGLRYEPLSHIGLFAEPQCSYMFQPENPAVKSYLTDNGAFNIHLRLGVSYSF